MATNTSVNNVHVNQLLTDFAIGYKPQGFVAEQVFSVVPVKHETDVYAVWTQSDFFRVTRADGTGSMVPDKAQSLEIASSYSRQTYKAEAYKLKTRISDREKGNQDPVINLEQRRVTEVQDLLLIDQELRVATLATTLANYATANRTTNSGTSQWNNASFASQTSAKQSTIIDQLLTARNAVRIATGGRATPNRVLIPFPVLMVLQNDVGIMDRIKFSKIPLSTDSSPLEDILGMKVVTPLSMFTTALEGNATQTLVDAWGKHVVLYYYEPNPGPFGLTFGTIFRSRDWTVRTWREDESECDVHEPSVIQDEVAVAFSAGYFIQNAIA